MHTQYYYPINTYQFQGVYISDVVEIQIDISNRKYLGNAARVGITYICRQLGNPFLCLNPRRVIYYDR